MLTYNTHMQNIENKVKSVSCLCHFSKRLVRIEAADFRKEKLFFSFHCSPINPDKLCHFAEGVCVCLCQSEYLSVSCHPPQSLISAEPSRGSHRFWGRGPVWSTGLSERRCAAWEGGTSRRFPNERRWGAEEEQEEGQGEGYIFFWLSLSLVTSSGRFGVRNQNPGRPHLRPEGGGLLRETGRCEVTDHVRHGPVQRAAGSPLALDAPVDGGGGAFIRKAKVWKYAQVKGQSDFYADDETVYLLTI